MKTLAILLGIFILAYSASAYTLPTSNATFINTSATSFNCTAKSTNTAGENISLFIYIATNKQGTLYSNYSACSTNTSINRSKIQSITAQPCEIIFCAAESSMCEFENGTTSVAQITIPGPNCTTTTTTLNTGVDYYPLYGLDEGGNMSGINNTSDIPSKILGLSKENFFSLVALLIITLTMVSLAKINKKLSIVASVASADIFTMVLPWINPPLSLLALINIMAVLIFAAGAKK